MKEKLSGDKVARLSRRKERYLSEEQYVLGGR